MIRGNERAVELGAELALALFPGEEVPMTVLAGLIDWSRQALNLPTEPFRVQDLFFLETRALGKMRKAAKKL